MKFPEPGINLLDLLQPPPREERAKTSHYASSLEGCPRKDYYKWVGAPVSNPTSESSIKKMQAGTDAHALFAMRLQRAKVGELQTEIPVEIEDSRLAYPLHGYIDATFTLDGETYVVEYKSTQYRSTDRALAAPFTGALLQLWAYMRAYKADHYYIVYEDRGSKLGCEYEVGEIDGVLYWRRGKMWQVALAGEQPLRWDAVIDKLAMIEQAVGDEEPPPRVDPISGEQFHAYLSKDGKKLQQSKTVYDGEEKKVLRSHWMCMGYCPYRDYCWLGSEQAAQVIAAGKAKEASKTMLKSRARQPGQLGFKPNEV